MSYLLNYKQWRAIHEAAIFEGIGASVQQLLAVSLDETAKKGLGEFELVLGKSAKTTTDTTTKLEAGITSDIKEILNVKNEYDENKAGLCPLISITAVSTPVSFKNAMGLNVPYDTSDKNGTFPNGHVDGSTLPFNDLVGRVSAANLQLFFDDVKTVATSYATNPVGSKWDVNGPFAFYSGSSSSPNILQGAGDTLNFAPDDNLPAELGATFASGQTFSKFFKKDGTIQVQTVIYTFGAFNPQGGADLQVSDTVSTVNVTTAEVESASTEKLDNANEVFTVGKATYVNPAEGAAKLKTAIQTIFNKFKNIKSIKVIGGASNEGGDALNQALVGQRATVVANLIATSWPELKTAVTAATTDYSKIQPQGQKVDANFRSIYLDIAGTKISTKETSTTSVDLAATSFKKDEIIINEYLITATLDAKASSLYAPVKVQVEKEQAEEANKLETEKKSAENVATQLKKTKAGYQIKIKSKSDPTKIVNVTVSKIDIDGTLFVKNPTEGQPDIAVSSDRFVGWTDDQAKAVAKEEKASTKKGTPLEGDI